MFCLRTSRILSSQPAQNRPAKSLFRKILPLTPSTSRFYRDQATSPPRNPKKTDTLPTRYTKKIAATSQALWLVLAFAFASPASAQILKITINDTIQPISAEYISRAIDEAHRRNAQTVLIEMNTPGGLVSSTREIIEKISSSAVPVIVYVTPTGGHAGSAGIFILESADVAAMAPGTAAGAAHPVTLIGPVQVKPDEEMNRKIENDAAALMRSFASKRGRNVESAESAVRESKSFTEQEALAQHLIDYVASSPDDLFRQMQGKIFKRFDGKSASLNLIGQPVVAFDMTLKEHILDGLMDPNIAFLILAIGALALYVEFNHPGAVIPGTVGVVFILLAAFALNFSSHTFCRARADPRSLRSLRRRSQVRQPRSSHRRRHRASHLGRSASGRFTHPRNARPPADRIGRSAFHSA